MRKTSPSTSSRGRVSPGVSSSTTNSRTRSPVVGSNKNNNNSSTNQQQQTPTDYQNLLRIKNLSSAGTQPSTANSSNTNSLYNTPRTNQQQQQQMVQHHHQNRSNFSGGGGTHPLARRSPRGVTPSNSGNNAAGGAISSTPNSARSAASMADLEGVISEVLRERMTSLTESRHRVEELADMQKRETEMFLSAMEQVLAQSQAASGAQRDMEEDFEDRLNREQGEKSRMLQILQRFKSEGDRVTADLKRALVDERDKHKESLYRNEHLANKVRELQQQVKMQQQQLKEQQYQLQDMREFGPSASSKNNNKNIQNENANNTNNNSSSSQQQVVQLVDLLKDHERVIDELERRNRNLEHDLRYQKNQQSRMLASSSTSRAGSLEGTFSGNSTGESISIPDTISTTETPQQQLSSMIQQFAANEQHQRRSSSSSSNNPNELDIVGNTMPPESMCQLIRGLLHQVRNENRMRLRVEEQSTKLVSDQDEQIRKLEARIRDFESYNANANKSISSGNLSSPSPVSGRAGGGSSSTVMSSKQPRPLSPRGNVSNNTNTNATEQQQQRAKVPGGDAISGTSNNINTNTRQVDIASRAGAPRLPNLSGVVGGSGGSNQNSNSNTPVEKEPLNHPAGSTFASSSQQEQEPKRQPTIGLEEYDNDNSSGKRTNRKTQHLIDDDSIFQPQENVAKGNNNNNNNRAASVTSASSKNNNNRDSSVEGLPSLEDQLNAVTSDFNNSIDTWNQAAGTTDPNNNNNNQQQQQQQQSNFVLDDSSDGSPPPPRGRNQPENEQSSPNASVANNNVVVDDSEFQPEGVAPL